MSTSHTVQQGEHLSGIAKKYGFRNYETIWNYGENADLKAKRKNPNVLFPGDELVIPDKEPKEVPCATTAMHVFNVTIPKLKLRVVVRDRAGKPMPNTECELEVEGEKETLQTNGDGLVEKLISVTARNGALRVPELQIESPIKIGHLDPIDEATGLTGRLSNLGYFRGDLEKPNEDELKSAVEEFQCDFKLTVDGKFGPQTEAKLREIHGC